MTTTEHTGRGSTETVDVLVVGAGVVGLAHAAEAMRRGLRVLVVERDHHATGASVRNFGHACVTAQSGALLDLALVAREHWLRYATDGGFHGVASGAVTVARSAAELAVLEELAADREPGQVTVLTAADTFSRLGGAGDPAIVGGAFLRDDVRVDPRTAVAGLAALLASRGVLFWWATSYLGREDPGDGTTPAVVRTSRGTVRAVRTIVCVGHDVDQLYPALAAAYGVERCGLQMALVEAPDGRRIAPAVLTGTSMLRYPAFVATSASAALRDEVQRERPDLVDIGANVMLTQRPDGSLIVGDSHRYGQTLDPFLDEPVSDTLLGDVARLLGVDRLRVRQRWTGVYASAPEPTLVAHPEHGLTVVSVTSGVGMTISHGLAARTWAALDAIAPGAPTAVDASAEPVVGAGSEPVPSVSPPWAGPDPAVPLAFTGTAHDVHRPPRPSSRPGR